MLAARQTQRTAAACPASHRAMRLRRVAIWSVTFMAAVYLLYDNRSLRAQAARERSAQELSVAQAAPARMRGSEDGALRPLAEPALGRAQLQARSDLIGASQAHAHEHKRLPQCSI